MTVLGIDPGFSRCGYAFVSLEKNGTYKIIEASLIETKKDTPYNKRLETIHNTLNEKIKKYNPDNAAIESLFFSKNTKTAMQVSEARGVIILTLSLNNLSFTEYKPREVKLSITGNGNADKNAVIKMVALFTGEKVLQDDTADAVAIAISHLSSIKTLVAKK